MAVKGKHSRLDCLTSGNILVTDLGIQWIVFGAVAAQCLGWICLQNQLLLWEWNFGWFWNEQPQRKHWKTFCRFFWIRRLGWNLRMTWSWMTCWAWKWPILTVQMYVPSSKIFSLFRVKEASPSPTTWAASMLEPVLSANTEDKELQQELTKHSQHLLYLLLVTVFEWFSDPEQFIVNLVHFLACSRAFDHTTVRQWHT